MVTKVSRRLAIVFAATQFYGCTTSSAPSSLSTSVSPYAVAGCGQTSTESFEEYISPGWQASSPVMQKIMIASDPQPFRFMTSREPYAEDVDERKWHRVFSESFTGLFKLQRQGSYHVPLIISGDMSEYGHGNERAAFRAEIKKMGMRDGPLMLPGLGNHDYENNVGNCANNGCARDAVCDHITWVSAIKARSTGVNFDHIYRSTTRTHEGSLAYSLDIGRVHVVQLNNEPTYSTKFSTGIGSKTTFDIRPSLDWLQADLEAASARGQYTLINMHRWSWSDETQAARFRTIAEANRVVAIFLGHEHKQLGYVGKWGKIPRFYGGSLLARNFSNLFFEWDKKVLQVNWYEDFSEAGELRYNLDTLDIEPPKVPETVKVTLYKEKHFAGQTCSGTVGIGQPFTLCSSHANVAGLSLKVEGFGGNDRELCIKLPWQSYRCYRGTFQGDFEIPDFGQFNPLPSGLTRRVWGNDSGFTWMSYE